MAKLRIPFAEAIEEKALLRGWFQQMSLPQQVALKATYGCDLSSAVADDRGFSELDHYWASQGFGEYDELGYLTAVNAPADAVYVPTEYPEAWAVWGVRAGKSDRYATTITVYEATCGGHEEFIRAGRPAICFQIAQDLKQAKYSLLSIKATLDEMPIAVREQWVKNAIADKIELKNGITILVTPPTIKSIRGYDSPVSVMDEVGIWYQLEDSANPDFEIYRQVSSRQAQFENPKIIGISSPWNKGGLLYLRAEAGTNGALIRCTECRVAERFDPNCPNCDVQRRPHRGRLIMHGTTAGLGNPLIQPRWLKAELAKDPKAFERECLARFQDSLSGFLPAPLLQEAVDAGILERSPAPLNFYVAAVDPGFRRDAFGFCIAHADGQKVVVDAVRRWTPVPGESLNPEQILAEMRPILQQFRVQVVLTDQYHFESLRQLAQQQGFSLQQVRFTATKKASLYGNLQQLVLQKRLRLLDHPEMLKELKSLERRLTHNGLVQVSAPEGQHDDLATVCALAVDAVIWMLPQEIVPAEPEPTAFQRCQEQIERKAPWRIQAEDPDWSWLEDRIDQ